jgi:hypothetical protein
MSDDLIKGIKSQLQAQRLQKSALDHPTAHVVVSDEQGNLHVLTKKDAAPIDAREAKVAGKQLDVKEGGEVPLGDLGVWRDFVVSGLPEIKAPAPGEKPLTLELSVKSKALVGGQSAFFSALDVGFAWSEIITKGEIAVRPTPPGERDGKQFVAVTPAMRQQLGALLGIHVDDAITADVLQRYVVAYRTLQEQAAPLLSAAITLGLPALSTPLPMVMAPPKQAAAEKTGLFTDKTTRFLEENNITLEDKPSVEDLEAALDALPEHTPDDVASEVRAAYTNAIEAAENADAAAEDELFGGLMGDEDEKKVEDKPKDGPAQVGASRLAQARNMRQAQLELGLKDLGVPSSQTAKLADLLAASLQPSPKPSIILVAGPPHTPADKIMELTQRIVSENPLTIGREDLSRAGFGAVYGHNNGVPTMSDAILSTGSFDKHRPSAARHVAVVVDDLTGVGTANPDTQEATLKDWLQRVVLMSQTGKVQSYENQEHKTTSLANSVFVMRWPGNPDDLKRVINSDPQLKHLLNALIEVEDSPTNGVAFLEKDLAAKLVAQAAPQNVSVSLEGDLKAQIESLYERMGSTEAYEVISSRLSAELKAAAETLPATSYAINFSRGLTARDKEKALRGQPLPGVSHIFQITAKQGDDEIKLEFSPRWRTWDDVVQQANKAATLEEEVARLRGELEKLGKKP